MARRVVNSIVVLVVLIYISQRLFDGSFAPGPGPAPITPTVSGFHYLIVEETGQERQWNYNDIRLDEFADKNCAKVSGTPEARIYDVDIDLTYASPDWREAMEDAKKHKDELPWLETWGNKRGQRLSQKLPADAESTVKLLESTKR